MMLLGTRDGEGSGADESPAEISGSLGYLHGCLLGCPLARREVNVEQVIVSIELNILLSLCLNVTLELFGYLELLDVWEYRRLSDVWMDFGFSFDAVPTIDTVLYFGVLELSEMNEDKIKIDR